jgi:DNA-binding MarR family transcriptional regulator
MLQQVEENEVILTDYDIWGRLTEVYKLIGNARALELSNYGLTPQHSHILRILTNRGGTSTIKELSDLTLRRQNSISLLVRRMEKAGLVRREKSILNGHYLIKITEEGSEAFKTMPLTSIEKIFSSLTAGEKTALTNCLNQLHRKALYYLGLDYVPPLLREAKSRRTVHQCR